MRTRTSSADTTSEQFNDHYPASPLFYQQVFENTPAMLFLLNDAGEILTVNGFGAAQLGYEPGELVGQSVVEIFHPDDRAGIQHHFQSCLQQPGELFQWEFRKIHKDGSIIWVEESARAFTDESNKINVMIVCEDITRRKVAEDDLHQKESKLQLFINQLPAILWTTDSELVFTSSESAGLSELNLTPGEVVGRSLYEYFNSDDDEYLPIKAHRSALDGEKQRYEFDFAAQTYQCAVEPLKDDNDTIIGTIGIAINATRQRITEKALQESENKYRALYETSRDTIVFLSPDGIIQDINPAGIELFGYESRSELTDVNFKDDLCYSPAVFDSLHYVLEQHGHVNDYELTVIRKDLQRRVVLITAAALRDANNMTYGYRGTLRDITKRKELEQKLLHAHKLEAIGRLAGGIAHDFNNLLFAILGFSKMTLESLSDTDENKPSLEGIYKAALQARELVNQILTFSRRSEYDRKPIKFHTVVNEALDLLRASLPTTIEIQRSIQNDTDYILADPTHIHQVVMNLCTNAYYAMRDGTGKLKVDLEQIEITEKLMHIAPNLEKKPYIRLTVSDSGHGMDEAVLDRIFDPFFTTKPFGEGTGMGLSVIHGIVKSHDGAINVSSEYGRGTTFQVYLPVIKIEETPEEQIEESVVTGGGSILFVDDEKLIASMCNLLLQQLGYSVTTTTSSADALRTIKDRGDTFDLLITDLTMPGMTGLELSAAVKNLHPEIPIILITGYSGENIHEKSKQIGIQEYLVKPITPVKLSQAIHRVLQQVKDIDTSG